MSCSTLPNLEGDWYFTGRPIIPHVRRFGRIRLQLRQHGTVLIGNLWQVQSPQQEKPTPGGDDPRLNPARVSGYIQLSSGQRPTMVTLTRLDEEGDFVALFTGTLDSANNQINGAFVNNQPGLGLFRMAREPWPELPVNELAARMVLSSEQDYPDEQHILGMADQFEEGLSHRDAARILALFVSEDIPFIGPAAGADAAKNQTISAFVRSATTRKELIEEKLEDRTVRILGNTAVLSCRFRYLVDTVERGSGEEVWTLVRSPNGWKILTCAWNDGASVKAADPA